MEDLRKKIKQSKLKYGITYKILSDLVSITPQSMTNYLTGKTELTQSRKEKISKFLQGLEKGVRDNDLYE